jgi:hypothetical protein
MLMLKRMSMLLDFLLLTEEAEAVLKRWEKR